MIRHCVMLQLAPDHDPAELAAVLHGLNDLVGQIEGYTALSYGPNIDLEAKTPEFGAGFIGTFTSRAALERYAADPRHQALGARLVQQCAGGADGILVFDIEETTP